MTHNRGRAATRNSMELASHAGSAGLHEIHCGTLGGLPAFWADAPGPYAAGLVFRVGRADETLATNGITHLVEHLGLPTLPAPGIDFNGLVSGIFTTVWAEGDEDAVLGFLERAAASLPAPAVDRIETERQITLTEAAQWEQNAVSAAALLRFGARGHGLVGCEELGLHWLGAEEVLAWARERFVGDAAALYVVGEAPADLTLDLCAGERPAPPEAAALANVQFPCAFTEGPPGGVALSFVGARSAELSVALGVAERRLRSRLRAGLALSYHVECVWEPLTRESGHGVLRADCRFGNEGVAADALIAVIDELADAGPTGDELELDLAERRRWMTVPSSAASALWFRAAEALLAAPFQNEEELLAEFSAVTPASAAGALAAALESALLLTADPAVPERFVPCPEEQAPVRGRRHRVRGRGRASLFVADDGVTIDAGDGQSATVRFIDCVAMQRWANGTLTLWGLDGSWITVNPETWRHGRDAIAAIDAAVPADAVVPMERELEARIEQVEAQLERRWSTSTEVDALPRVLCDGEQLIAASPASKGLRLGVLAVTTGRLLFLYFERTVVELDRTKIVAVEQSPETWWRDNRLVVRTNGGEYAFREIKRLDEIVEALEPA